MQPIRFGGVQFGFVHPLILIAVLIGAALILLLPRKQVMTPLLMTSILVPMDQVVVIAGFHFQMIRLLILVGWIRVLMNGGAGGRRWTAIDRGIVAWAILTAIDISLLWQSTAAFQNQLGTLYTVFGVYFLLRALSQDQNALVTAIRSLAWTSAVVACVMIVEQATHRNPYAYIWATAPQGSSVMERDGKFRAMACFAHPLLAGSFGAICLPMFVWLWRASKKSRTLAWAGMASSTAIVLAANSSTPLLAYVGSLLALMLWPIRTRMRMLRWGMVIVLVALHLTMKAPVWALIARIDVTGSSSGYHRYQLVDQFIRHFGDWWMLGTTHNADWGWDMWDLANQYVAVGETSGLLPFIFFIAIIVCSFKMIGKARKQARDRATESFVWALGAAMFANVVAFFGISYYDQTMVVWYLLLAIIPVGCAPKPVPVERNSLLPPAGSTDPSPLNHSPAFG